MHLSTSRLVSFFAALAVGLTCATPAGAAPHPPKITCARCIVVDESGRVLYARNPRDRFPNASTTKMVTALLVAHRADPDETVVVSGAAAAVGGGGLDLVPGDVFTVDQLMRAMLLDSSNEAAAALAEHVGGTTARFVALMNAYLRRIGADRTHFVNPHGLDAPGHYASAADLASIGRHVLDDPYLARIVALRRATIPTPRGPATFDNRNLLLESYRGAIGIKTGYTLGAGNVLVAAARRNGHTL
ncbi:MAG TPA: serine hydrolase, partial [Actinomycetota bacterium]|nr:serine hydrolase [Actinomycetota bacterium]